MRLVSTSHYMLESDPYLKIVEYGADEAKDTVFVYLFDNGGHPNIILSAPHGDREKWLRAIAAFNAEMGGKDGTI